MVFHALAPEHIRQIVDLQLADVRDNLRTKDMTLEVSVALLDHLADKGWDPVFGARPLRRSIQEAIEDRLSDALLEGDFEEGDGVRMDFVAGEVTIERVDPPPPVEPAESGEPEESAEPEEQEPVLTP